MTGTVKRVIADKGFGFISGEDGKEYFFHRSACNAVRFEQLKEGQAITFDADNSSNKGPRAENLH